MDRCKECNRAINRKRFYTSSSFRKTFKVGDKLCGWGTGNVVIITAMGETRFLFKNDKNSTKERVATYEHAMGWEKV